MSKTFEELIGDLAESRLRIIDLQDRVTGLLEMNASLAERYRRHAVVLDGVRDALDLDHGDDIVEEARKMQRDSDRLSALRCKLERDLREDADAEV